MRKKEILPFATTWMDLEGIMLSEVSQTQKGNYFIISLICGIFKKSQTYGTSLVAQWLRIHLPMQGTRVLSRVWEDTTCCGTTEPVCHNY